MIVRFASFVASVPLADVSGQYIARAFIFCSRNASIVYSRIAGIFESRRYGEFLAVLQDNVLDPALN